MKKQEIRISSFGELRATETGQRISGYAAVYNEPAEIGDFTEVIKPGAFSKPLREKQDVRLLLNHDCNNILARTSSGTLALTADDRGLAFIADLPDTQLGRDVYTLIKRGDLSGCSFAFTVAKDAWPTQERREILEIARLFDVGPVAYPAYEGTSVKARRELIAAELRNVPFATVGFYGGTPSRQRQEQSRPSVSMASELERLRLRFRALKLQS